MKRSLMVLFIIFGWIGTVYADGAKHRIGVALGSFAGTYTEEGINDIDMEGAYVEAPYYSYTFDSNFVLSVRNIGIALIGNSTETLLFDDGSTLDVDVELIYTLGVLAPGIGYNIKVSDSFSIAPQLVFGSGPAELEVNLTAVTVFGTLESTDTEEGTGSISGIIVPFYFDLSDHFHLGFQLALLGGGSEVGDTGELALNGGFQVMLGGHF